MANENAYNSPSSTASGTASNIGPQAITDYYFKKALIAVRDHQYFMPLADVRAMPKHMGKKIKQDVYVALLDNANENDQGLNAAGAVITKNTWSAWDSSGDLIGAEGAYATETLAIAASGAVDVAEVGGNLYGSSKDTGACLLYTSPSPRD